MTRFEGDSLTQVAEFQWVSGINGSDGAILGSGGWSCQDNNNNNNNKGAKYLVFRRQKRIRLIKIDVNGSRSVKGRVVLAQDLEIG